MSGGRWWRCRHGCGCRRRSRPTGASSRLYSTTLRPRPASPPTARTCTGALRARGLGLRRVRRLRHLRAWVARPAPQAAAAGSAGCWLLPRTDGRARDLRSPRAWVLRRLMSVAGHGWPGPVPAAAGTASGALCHSRAAPPPMFSPAAGLRQRSAFRPARDALRWRWIPGSTASQLWRRRIHAPRRRRVRSGWSWRDATRSADRAASRADTGIADDRADSRIRGLAFASPATTVRASSLSAVLQFSGRAADDEHAVGNECELRAIRAIWCSAWLWHGLATPSGLSAGRVAHSAAACDEPIAGPGIADNQPRGGLGRCGGKRCSGTSRSNGVPTATGADGDRRQGCCRRCGRGCGRRDFGRRDSANPVAAHR